MNSPADAILASAGEFGSPVFFPNKPVGNDRAEPVIQV
jgi:hypothetical protein